MFFKKKLIIVELHQVVQKYPKIVKRIAPLYPFDKHLVSHPKRHARLLDGDLRVHEAGNIFHILLLGAVNTGRVFVYDSFDGSVTVNCLVKFVQPENNIIVYVSQYIIRQPLAVYPGNTEKSWGHTIWLQLFRVPNTPVTEGR